MSSQSEGVVSSIKVLLNKQTPLSKEFGIGLSFLGRQLLNWFTIIRGATDYTKAENRKHFPHA